jgi:hypothetical protein
MVMKDLSKSPAKTKIIRVLFLGPKGGYHRLPFTFKLKLDEGSAPHRGVMVNDPRKTERGRRILQQNSASGWIQRVVEWYNSDRKIHTFGDPSGYLLYRIHKNDVLNHRLVKAGWRIAEWGD